MTVQERFQLVAHVAVRLSDGKRVPEKELRNIGSAISYAAHGDFDQILRVALLADYMREREALRSAVFLLDDDLPTALTASMVLVLQAKAMSMDLAGKSVECDRFLNRKVLAASVKECFGTNPISFTKGELTVHDLRLKPRELGIQSGFERSRNCFSQAFQDQNSALIRSFWRENDGEPKAGQPPPSQNRKSHSHLTGTSEMETQNLKLLALSRSLADLKLLIELALALRETFDFSPPDTFDNSFETEHFRERPWWDVADLMLHEYRFAMCVLTDRQKAYYFVGVLAGALELLSGQPTKKNRERARRFSGILEDLFDERTGWQHQFWSTLRPHELELVGRVFLAIVPFVRSWGLSPGLWPRLACEGSKWVINGEFAASEA